MLHFRDVFTFNQNPEKDSDFIVAYKSNFNNASSIKKSFNLDWNKVIDLQLYWDLKTQNLMFKIISDDGTFELKDGLPVSKEFIDLNTDKKHSFAFGGILNLLNRNKIIETNFRLFVHITNSNSIPWLILNHKNLRFPDN